MVKNTGGKMLRRFGQVHRLTRRIGRRTAATVPMVALTCQQGMFDLGHLSPGQTVAVLGAGGGVGTFAVQLARAAGARVVAVARAWACDLLRGLGAEVYVDVDHAPLGDVDLVFDLVGGETLRRSCAAVKAGGGVVSVVERQPVATGTSRRMVQTLGLRAARGRPGPFRTDRFDESCSG